MPRAMPVARRSGPEWLVRALLAAAAAILGYVSVAQTLAYTLRASDPDRAHALAPADGRITALVAQGLAGPDASVADRGRAKRLAREALRKDPTAVGAVATLGFDAQIAGDTAAARRLFQYAERLSRRDLATQIWAIEDAVGRGDIAQALRHYDVALRTSANAPDVLFPVLAAAIGEPSIRAGLTRTLHGDAVWGPSFLNFASANADPRAAVALFGALSRAGVAVTDEPRARLVARLLAGGFARDAWDYYAAGRAGDPRTSRDPRFSANHAIPTAFDWTPVNDAGVSTSIQRDAGGGVFDFAAPASIGGPLLRQTEMLPPGMYRLAGHSIGIDQLEDARPYWSLRCDGGGELGRIALPNSATAGGGFAGRFTVPPECPVQTLMLVARPSNAAGGQSGQIDRVLLAPLRR